MKEKSAPQIEEPMDPLAARAMRIVIDALLERRRELDARRQAREGGDERSR